MSEREAVKRDLQETLSSDAAKRWFGSFFYTCNPSKRIFNENALVMAYKVGVHEAAGVVMDSMREIDPRLPGECELAYRKFRDAWKRERRDSDDE